MKNKKKNLKQMIALGSKTAKGGFTNEQDVIDRFNSWKTDKVAQEWLAEMNYKIDDIEFVKKEFGQKEASEKFNIPYKLNEREKIEEVRARLMSQGYDIVKTQELNEDIYFLEQNGYIVK